jgi:hypothetical protein
MPVVDASPARRGRLRILAAIGKEIAEHEAALATLRATRDKLIRQDERGKCEDEINDLRVRLAIYEGEK